MMVIPIPGLYVSAIKPIMGANMAANRDLVCDVTDKVVAIDSSFDMFATNPIPIGFLKFSIIITIINPTIGKI